MINIVNDRVNLIDYHAGNFIYWAAGLGGYCWAGSEVGLEAAWLGVVWLEAAGWVVEAALTVWASSGSLRLSTDVELFLPLLALVAV